ncbi:MAG: Hsp20/alpha crystallin family protein [Deltaproteobacteria bacterium HGW-Deltaproteobacteria-10]|nr:MAG: Hsp20/alpha crystallin family protein [Deltaproteobacteria bacterium HGW-Deltaproteobacteria-10]
MFTPSLWRFRRFPDAAPEMLRLQQEMNRLFSNAGRRSQQDYPAVNIWENTKSAVLTVELPGIDPEKIDIEVTGDILTLSGTSQIYNLKEGETYLRQERIQGSFKRKIQLSFPIDPKKVEARYEKGILSITLPRLEDSLPKKIKIN